MSFYYKLFFLIVIFSYINICNFKNVFISEMCLASIQERFVGIKVNRGSSLMRSMTESLQAAIFDYLICQRKLLDLRTSGYSKNSDEIRRAMEDFQDAIDNLRISKSKWESSVKVIPGFSYGEETVFSDDVGLNLNEYIGLGRDFSMIKDYEGDRGIDFQSRITEENNPVYYKPTLTNKLSRDTINKLNLGFSYDELPSKFIKMIDERELVRKQSGNKLKKSILRKQNLNDYSLEAGNYKFTEGLKEYNEILKKLKSKKDLLLDDSDYDFSSGIEHIIGDFSNRIDEYKNENLQGKKNIKRINLEGTNKNKQKILKKKKTKVKRSRGALENQAILPTDVASEIEKFLGGPMKHISISDEELNKNELLSKIYSEYLKITLKCINLYDQKSTFEKLFLCSKKQTELLFDLIHILTKLNIKYDYEKSSIEKIEKKMRDDIKDFEKEDNPIEDENFLNFLIESNIFGNYSNTTDSYGLDEQINSESLSLNNSSTSSFKEEFEVPEIPNYLESLMRKFKFTREEYYSSPTISKNVDLLADIEAQLYECFIKSEPVSPELIFRYNLIADILSRELKSKRFILQFNNSSYEVPL